MSLQHIFKSRTERAARVLDSSDVGPKQIKFLSADLSDADTLAELHEQFPRKKSGAFYLYRMSLDTEEAGTVARARSAFRSVRMTGTWNMSRDNHEHPDSSSLYVGTSESMHDRFRSHLGKGNGKATWGLYLAAWARPLKAGFVVEYYELQETIAEDVELIEGVLWDSLRPLFGKKGGR
jgi:hypothetical protein